MHTSVQPVEPQTRVISGRNAFFLPDFQFRFNLTTERPGCLASDIATPFLNFWLRFARQYTHHFLVAGYNDANSELLLPAAGLTYKAALSLAPKRMTSVLAPPNPVHCLPLLHNSLMKKPRSASLISVQNHSAFELLPFFLRSY